MLDFSKLQEGLEALGMISSSGQNKSGTVTGGSPAPADTSAAGTFRPSGHQAAGSGRPSSAPDGPGFSGGTLLDDAAAGACVTVQSEVEVSDDGVSVEVEWLARDDDGPAQETRQEAAGNSQRSMDDAFGELFANFHFGSPERKKNPDDLLKELLDVQEMYLKGDAGYRRNLSGLMAAAKKEGENGNSYICEVIGTTYLILDPEAFGLTRSDCVREAVGWYYKAAGDMNYRRRGSCGMQIARLSSKPKFLNLDFKQASDWFGWAADELKGSDAAQTEEAYMELGRIAEWQGRYEDAARWWKKADDLSGGTRGQVELGRMQIFRSLDQFDGLNRLKTLAENGDPYAAVAIVELTWTLQLPDELNEEVPYDDLPDMLEKFAASVPDAKAALASLTMGEDESDEYQENLEEEEFFAELTDAASHNSALACYFLGKCYTRQLGHAVDTDMSAEDLSALAGKALSYFRMSAGEGFLPALKDFVLVNSICYGFDEDTSRYCDILDLYGEKKYADSFRSDKEQLNEDKLFC